MIDTSQDIFWVVLSASIALFTIFLSLVLFRTAKILQEAEKTVKDINDKLSKTNGVFDETIATASSIMKSIKGIDEGLLKPVMSIGSAARGVLNIFRKNSNK